MSVPPESFSRPGQMSITGRRALPALICFSIALVLALTRVVREKIYMDEQLFIGGAGLMARGEGLIHRDFFYNHMPVQALVSTVLFQLTKHWALAARTLDAVCGAALTAVLFEAGRRAFTGAHAVWRIVLAACVAAIFLLNPVTADAIGKAWNHDLAALACVAGFVLLAKGLGVPRPRWWVIAAGACAAISVTTRLTFAPPLIGFPLLVFVAPGYSWRPRMKLLGLFALGGVIAAVPTLVLFALSPANAFFENFRFPAMTQRYHLETTGNPRGSLGAKYQYVWREVALSWPLIVLVWMTIGVSALAFRPLRIRSSLVHARFACLLVMLLAACAASLVPTPMFHQYLYGPVPFAGLVIAWGLASLRIERRWWAGVGFVALTCFSVAKGWHDPAKEPRDYRGVATLLTPSKWTTTQWHRDAKRLARLAGPGKVLTFVPGLALEAGLPIYTELSIGRYATRIADYLTPEQRAAMHVPDLATMRQWFETDPPAAVFLVDPNSSLEASIAQIATEHGYVAQSFDDTRTVYLPPK